MQLPVLHRGTESLIRSLDYPNKLDPKAAWGELKYYKVFSYSMSGDGKRLWVVLFNPEEKDLVKRVQVWSMNTEGGDVKQSAFAWPEHPGTVQKIATNRDGSIAWLHISHKHPNTNDNHAFMQKMTPGGKAEVVIDTIKVKGITHVMEWRLTGDGRMALMVTNEGLTRIEEGGKHHVVLPLKHIEHKGSNAANGGGIGNLVVSADGSRWALTARVGPYHLQGKTPMAVVFGSPQGHKLFVDPANKDGAYDEYRRLVMSDDGNTVLVARKTETRVFRNGQVVSTWPDLSYPQFVVSEMKEAVPSALGWS